jgi:hypothetical protein
VHRTNINDRCFAAFVTSADSIPISWDFKDLQPGKVSPRLPAAPNSAPAIRVTARLCAAIFPREAKTAASRSHRSGRVEGLDMGGFQRGQKEPYHKFVFSEMKM